MNTFIAISRLRLWRDEHFHARVSLN